MTIVERFARRKSLSAKSIGGQKHRNSKGIFKRKLLRRGGDSYNSKLPVEVSEDVALAIRADVDDLLSSSRSHTCTVLDLAEALKRSDRIFRDSIGKPQKFKNTFERLANKFQSFKISSRHADEGVILKYTLLAAFETLEKTPDLIGKRIKSWEEASKILSKVLIIPPAALRSDSLKNLQDAVDSVEASPPVSPKNGVSKYLHRLEAIKHRESMTPNSLKWKKLELLPVPSKLGSGSVLDGADSVLQKDLERQLERHRARGENQAALEIETQLKLREQEEEARKRAESLLRPLTDEENEIVDEAISGYGDDQEILAQVGTDSVQRGSMARLQPGQWLNDEIIHYFLVMLEKRDEELCAKDPSRKRCHFFKSFFITKLLNVGHANPDMDGQYEYRNVKRWSKKVPGKDIFRLDKIIFPINQNQAHWVCAVAFMQEKKVQMYDSMGSNGEYYLESIFQYLQDEHKDKKKAPLPDADEWKLVPTTRQTPRQLNGYDCGVFTCMFADFVSKDCPLSFDQGHLTLCRRRIALSIMNGKAIM